MEYPSTARPATEPPAAPGEHVAALAAPRQRRGGPIVVSGRFHVLAATARALVVPPHRALVVATIVGIGGSCHAGLPFASASLFPDDVSEAKGGLSGWFQVDVAALSGFPYAGVYHVTCSLGALVAPPVRIEIT